ncbi:hypothetical protein [Streptomyces sp. NPDC017940]|uniref:hypothetical protein n=1 Tax=Streptomyces sp. NPDC017940 TaxID=3365017 RepID=UPI0037B25385
MTSVNYRICSALRYLLEVMKRKEARTASHRAAVNDLRCQGLAVDGGRTPAGEETRLPTKDGLAAAAIDLDREIDEMGSMLKRRFAPAPRT